MSRTDRQFRINGRKIGPDHPVYIIAELSANHRQSYDSAKKLVTAAKKAGADAVKIQTYTADTITLPCRSRLFRVGGGTIWDGKTLHDLYKEAYMPWEWQPKLKKFAEKLAIDLFSSPFDPTAVEFLKKMAVPAFKIASFELVDIPLLKHIAKTGKPVILSTGMATMAEIREALDALKKNGDPPTALLKCTSAYPAPPEGMNLLSIPHYAKVFNLPVGLSDHTLGSTASIAAVALGACIIEKHFTLSRKEKSPDSAFSMEPDEFEVMVKEIRRAEKMCKRVTGSSNKNENALRKFRRSLFAVQDIAKGESITLSNVRSIRPADGLPPKFYDEILGKRAQRSIKTGTPIRWQLLTNKV